MSESRPPLTGAWVHGSWVPTYRHRQVVAIQRYRTISRDCRGDAGCTLEGRAAGGKTRIPGAFGLAERTPQSSGTAGQTLDYLTGIGWRIRAVYQRFYPHLDAANGLLPSYRLLGRAHGITIVIVLGATESPHRIRPSRVRSLPIGTAA